MTEKIIIKNPKKVDLRNFTWPIILISAGTTLLLNNLGIISWEVWNIVFKFWPALLILAGFEYILGNNFVGTLLSFFITTAVIIFIFVFSISVVNRPFDQFLSSKYRFWGHIKRNVPEARVRGPFFRCSPFDENCLNFYN